MTSAPFGSRLLDPLLSDPQTSALFTDRAALEAMLQFEVALARAEERCGVIPPGCARAIADAARTLDPDWNALGAGVQQAGHPVTALVKQLRAAAAPRGEYVHWGSNLARCHRQRARHPSPRGLSRPRRAPGGSHRPLLATCRRASRNGHGRTHPFAASRTDHLRPEGRRVDCAAQAPPPTPRRTAPAPARPAVRRSGGNSRRARRPRPRRKRGSGEGTRPRPSPRCPGIPNATLSARRPPGLLW